MSKEPKRNVYVGHRYVPKIMGEWDKTESYEGLSIVTNEGTSYTSKKRVPKGIDILNEEYWVVTGNYNAQIEEYRKVVRDVQKAMGKLEEDTDKKVNDFKNETNTNINNIENNIKEDTDKKINDFKNETNTNINNIENNINNIENNIKEDKKIFERIILNILDFNVDSTGEEDSLKGFQNALDLIKKNGGGHLIIPTGEYKIDGMLEIPSNLHLEITSNATILNQKVLLFYFPVKNKGYKGGTNNVVIDGGGTIKANDLSESNGIASSLHHSDNITIKDINFVNAVGSSHVFDLCGCSNIKILDCNFIGFNPKEGRENVEAIQIDYSSYQGLTHKNEHEREYVDGLTTKNVMIKGCKFLPIYYDNDSIKYYAPNPFGNHSQWGNDYHENIQFIDNYVENNYPLPSTNGPNTGMIHLPMVDGLFIKNNIFKTTQKKENGIIVLSGNNSTKRIQDVKESSPQYYLIEDENKLLNSKNIYIENNIFDGFINDENKNQSFIFRGRNLKNGIFKNINIIGNKFLNFIREEDWYNEALPNQDIIIATHCETITIKNNYVDLAKRLFYNGINPNENLIVDSNTFDRISGECIHTLETRNMFVSNNKLLQGRSLVHSSNGKNILVSNNITSSKNTKQAGSIPRNRHINIYDFDYVNINNNILESTTEQNAGIFEENNKKGYLNANLIHGFSKDIINDSTNVINLNKKLEE